MAQEQEIKGCGQSQTIPYPIDDSKREFTCPLTRRKIKVYPDGTSVGCEGCHGYIDPFQA